MSYVAGIDLSSVAVHVVAIDEDSGVYVSRLVAYLEALPLTLGGRGDPPSVASRGVPRPPISPVIFVSASNRLQEDLMADSGVRTCKRGHLQTDENVQFDADGRYRCRPCARARRHRRYVSGKVSCPKCGRRMAADSSECVTCRRSHDLEERFLRWVEKTDTCWLWKGHCDHKGYGRFQLAKHRSDRSHRVAYRLYVGPIPEGHELHHTCGQRNCVKAAHLVPITASEHARFHRLNEGRR